MKATTNHFEDFYWNEIAGYEREVEELVIGWEWYNGNEIKIRLYFNTQDEKNEFITRIHQDN